jgi:hypothetical protein
LGKAFEPPELLLELPPELLLELLELLLELLELLVVAPELLPLLVVLTDPPPELLMPVVTATLEVVELLPSVEVATMVDVPVALLRVQTALVSVLLTKKPGRALPVANAMAHESPVLRLVVQAVTELFAGITVFTKNAVPTNSGL